jgi:hypothetical protein
MSKPEEIKKSIEKIKKQIADPNVPDAIKELLKIKVLPKLEKDLAESSPAGKTYEKEVDRQKKTGDYKEGEGISLLAMSKAINKPKPAKKTISLDDFAKKTGIEITHMTPKTEPKSEKRVGVPRPKSEQQEVEYDCDELIKQAKERKAKAKARAEQPKKTEATKNKEKIEKVYDNVKERAESDDITKGELEKLISETKTLLKLLEAKLSSL